MYKPAISLALSSLLLYALASLTACGPLARNPATPDQLVESAAEPVVAVVARAPTATNFPRIGTPTPIPPSPTPAPTPTPSAALQLFDDATLADLMAGTIEAAGLEAVVQIEDERAAGGDRQAIITITSRYNLGESDLLLKFFVLEAGNALRAVRAFSQGTLDADLDQMHLIVNNRQGELLGTMTATTDQIDAFMEGRLSVNQALDEIELSGVFETFRQ